MLVVSLIIGVVLALLSKKRNYPVWESITWFIAGWLVSILSIAIFISRIIIEEKGWRVGLISAVPIIVGTVSLSIDVLYVLVGGGFFSRSELGAASIIGVLLILVGLYIGFSSKESEKSLEDKISEIDNLLSNGKITQEEYNGLRASLLASQNS